MYKSLDYVDVDRLNYLVYVLDTIALYVYHVVLLVVFYYILKSIELGA